MRKLVFLAALSLLCFQKTSVAQSAIDGTWKIDLSQGVPSDKPDVYLLQNGMYECKSCDVPFKVKADGTDQAITGNPYIDTVAIKVVNDHEIEETDKKGGKLAGNSTSTVSVDGNTVAFIFSDSSNTNGGPPVTGKGTLVRVAKGPGGSHAISGSWKLEKASGSDNGLMWTYKVSGDELTMSNPTGQTYTAKLDGTNAPMKGDPGVTNVSVKLIGNDTLEETDMKGAKVIAVVRFTVASDGKTAKVNVDDRMQNRTFDLSAIKQ